MSDVAAKAEGGGPPPVEREALLTSVDGLTLAMVAILSLVSPIVVHRGVAGWWLPLLFVAYGAGVVLLALARRHFPGRRLIAWVHLFQPAISVPVVFWAYYWIVPGLNPGGPRDEMLIDWDRRLLGFDPAEAVRVLESPLMTDLMHLVYGVYFILPFWLAIELLVRRKADAVRECFFVVVLSYYLCYIGYVAVPAEGPRLAIFHSNEMEGWLLTQPLRDLMNFLEPNKFDAFPSGHTISTCVVTIMALRHTPRSGWIMLGLVPPILFSLIYTRYHYVVDVLAGLVFVAVTIGAGIPLHAWWTRRFGKVPAPIGEEAT